MGKAGATLTAVAPEARVASRAAGRRRPPASDPRVTTPGSKAAKQREEIEAIKAARPPEPAPPAPTASDSPPPTSSWGGPSLPAMPQAASTGSGFLLGVAVWAGALAYLQGGVPGLKKFINAKLFNKV